MAAASHVPARSHGQRPPVVQGVSTRLSSPDTVKRKQGMRIGRIFSTLAGFAAPADLSTDDLDEDRQEARQEAGQDPAVAPEEAGALFGEEDLDMETSEIWWGRPGSAGSCGPSRSGGVAGRLLVTASSQHGDHRGAASTPVSRSDLYGRAARAAASVMKVRCVLARLGMPMVKQQWFRSAICSSGACGLRSETGSSTPWM